MKKDIIKVYAFELALLVILFFALFVSNILSKIVLAIVITIIAFVLSKSIKKRDIISTKSRQVLILMIAFASIYILTFYLMGFYFGFYEQIIQFSFKTLYTYIIPFIMIIVSAEVIRKVLLVQKAKFSVPITYVIMVLIDLIVYSGVYNITSLSGFLSVIGYVLFASLSCNLLYNYISKRFGAKPVIAFRLITVLYVYLIPIIPDVYVFFKSFLRMIYPFFIYLVLEYTYAKPEFVLAKKDRTKNNCIIIAMTVIMVLITMLISCQFKYGILVIGSSSMTGTIDKGDAIVYESYKNQILEEGDIIIFNKDKLKLVHRIVEIKKVNGQRIYYTQGDANRQRDEGFIKDSDIEGITKFKIVNIGYPTIWIRDIFK